MARTDTTETATAADLEQQIKTLRDDILALTSTVASYGQNQGARLANKASDGAAHLNGMAKDATELARLKAQGLYDETETAVRQNPAASVGIAAGVGFLVGLLLSRR